MNWSFKNRLPIQDRLQDLIKLTLEAAKHEREALLRKLHKLQHGS